MPTSSNHQAGQFVIFLIRRHQVYIFYTAVYKNGPENCDDRQNFKSCTPYKLKIVKLWVKMILVARTKMMEEITVVLQRKPAPRRVRKPRKMILTPLKKMRHPSSPGSIFDRVGNQETRLIYPATFKFKTSFLSRRDSRLTCLFAWAGKFSGKVLTKNPRLLPDSHQMSFLFKPSLRRVSLLYYEFGDRFGWQICKSQSVMMTSVSISFSSLYDERFHFLFSGRANRHDIPPRYIGKVLQDLYTAMLHDRVSMLTRTSY